MALVAVAEAPDPRACRKQRACAAAAPDGVGFTMDHHDWWALNTKNNNKKKNNNGSKKPTNNTNNSSD